MQSHKDDMVCDGLPATPFPDATHTCAICTRPLWRPVAPVCNAGHLMCQVCALRRCVTVTQNTCHMCRAPLGDTRNYLRRRPDLEVFVRGCKDATEHAVALSVAAATAGDEGACPTDAIRLCPFTYTAWEVSMTRFADAMTVLQARHEFEFSGLRGTREFTLRHLDGVVTGRLSWTSHADSDPKAVLDTGARIADGSTGYRRVAILLGRTIETSTVVREAADPLRAVLTYLLQAVLPVACGRFGISTGVRWADETRLCVDMHTLVAIHAATDPASICKAVLCAFSMANYVRALASFAHEVALLAWTLHRCNSAAASPYSDFSDTCALTTRLYECGVRAAFATASKLYASTGPTAAAASGAALADLPRSRSDSGGSASASSPLSCSTPPVDADDLVAADLVTADCVCEQLAPADKLGPAHAGCAAVLSHAASALLRACALAALALRSSGSTGLPMLDLPGTPPRGPFVAASFLAMCRWIAARHNTALANECDADTNFTHCPGPDHTFTPLHLLPLSAFAPRIEFADGMCFYADPLTNSALVIRRANLSQDHSRVMEMMTHSGRISVNEYYGCFSAQIAQLAPTGVWNVSVCFFSLPAEDTPAQWERVRAFLYNNGGQSVPIPV